MKFYKHINKALTNNVMNNLINKFISLFNDGINKLPPRKLFIVFILLCIIISIVMFSSCGTTTHLSIRADSMNLVQPNIEFTDSSYFKPR